MQQTTHTQGQKIQQMAMHQHQPMEVSERLTTVGPVNWQ